jgi:hypothetical protein
MIKPPSGETTSKIQNRWYLYFKVTWNFYLHNLFELCNAHKVDSLSVLIMIGLHWSN